MTIAERDSGEAIAYLRDSERLKWGEISEKVGLTKEGARSRYRAYKLTEDGLIKNAIGMSEGDDAVDMPIIEGYQGADYFPDPEHIDQIWQSLMSGQSRRIDRVKSIRKAQNIQMSELPFGLALMSDLHIGDPFCDYKQVYKDTDIIRRTPGLFTGFAGDGLNNWCIGKLIALQKMEVVSYDNEWWLFLDFLDRIADKLLFVVAGNHGQLDA